MSQTLIETCCSCHRAIKQNETPCVFEDQVVCPDCIAKLPNQPACPNCGSRFRPREVRNNFLVILFFLVFLVLRVAPTFSMNLATPIIWMLGLDADISGPLIAGIAVGGVWFLLEKLWGSAAQCSQCSAWLGCWHTALTVGTTRSYPPPIAGWLILLAFEMVFGPLATLMNAGEFRIAVYQLREAGIPAQFPDVHLLEMFVVVTAWLFAAVQVLAAVFFFRKHRFVPKMMVGLYALGVAYSLILLAAMASVFTLPLIAEGVIKFAIQLAFAVICTVYFLRSKRVKATFVR